MSAIDGFSPALPVEAANGDDVLAETADASFGDAWIAPYNDRLEGTNVAVIRNPAVLSLLRQGQARGEVVLESVTAAQVRQTQLSGLRHRREGLATRLWFARLFGRWVPANRVGPAIGTVGLVAIQLIRVAVRRLTNSSSFSPSGAFTSRLLKALIYLNKKLRRFAVRNVPAAPRVKPTAEQRLALRSHEH